MYAAAKRAIKSVVPPPAWKRFYSRHYQSIRPLTVDYCPVRLPWMGRSLDPMSRVHRLSTEFEYQGRRPIPTTCVRWLALGVWPFRLVSSMLEESHKHGRAVHERTGLTRFQQIRQMASLALTDNCTPVSYYRFRLYEPGNARRASAYVHADELDALHEALTWRLPSLEPLDDKHRFYEEGRRNGLPVAGLLGVFEGGASLDGYAPPSTLPACDLVLKPAHELCGRGVERWRYLETTRRWEREGQQHDGSGLLAHCRHVSREKKHVLQERLLNHDAIAILAPNGLATVRVVSYRRPRGEAGILMSCLRMPTQGQSVDNFAAGGIAAPIDATGVLGPALAKDPTRGTFDRHPDSGAQISGAPVPFYAESLDLALRAHAAFSWVPMVGWDIVVTPTGPMLLEANPSWCVELAQIVPNVPLGETSYPALLLEHLDAQDATFGRTPGRSSRTRHLDLAARLP